MKNQEKETFVALELNEIKEAFSRQKENLHWTFFNAREFMENLLQNRFNFLLLIFSLFTAAFFQANDNENKLLILSIGLIIILLLWITIYRIYIKFDIILKILYELDKDGVSAIIEKEAKAKAKIFKFPVNNFIGIIIPLVMASFYFIGILMILFKCDYILYIKKLIIFLN